MPKSLMLVMSKPASPDVEAKYNQWYTEKHLVDLTRLPGVVSATRYKLEKSVEAMPGISPDTRDYLAIYELEAQSPEEMASFTTGLRAALEAGRMDVSPAFPFKYRIA